jgi:glutaminyl-peptide cyclotransferase
LNRWLRCVAVLALLPVACDSGPRPNEARASEAAQTSPAAVPQTAESIPVYSVRVVKEYPHDSTAFTQGLEFHNGFLYESTGEYGQSTLRKVSLETGKTVKKIALAPTYFGEGLTLLDGKIYQLTWTTKKGFVYDAQTFRETGQFSYDTEGWGLTNDGHSLILSDGTNQIHFLDPQTFRTTKSIEVYAGSEAVANLNELEYVDGLIYANIWHAPKIAKIDPQSGEVKAWVDLSALERKNENGGEGVLNGIAYDAEGHRLFVTGKDWAKLFQIEIEKK